MNIETLDILKGEDKTETITRIRKRQTCEECGEVAHFKHTFLLPNARTNPASSGYGRDDISWCSDAHQFSCRERECQREMKKMDGYEWCATFPAVSQFAHMFLYWEEVKETREDEDETT